jgi:curli biogenesis system outer membrane secretion channel CsgG
MKKEEIDMKSSLRRKRVATILALSFTLASCLTAQGSSKHSDSSKAGATPVKGGEPSQPGARKRIAVGVFSGDTGGIADQLTTELVKSGRLVVVERTHLEGVTQERDLGTSSQTTAETAVQAGQLLGAELVITGSVTQASETGPRGINVGVGGIGHILDSMGAGVSGTTAKVDLEVRLVDATNGQIVYSFRAQGKASSHGTSVQLEKNLMNVGGDRPAQTPLGEATRKAVEQAAATILEKTQDPSWSGQATGQVVEVMNGQVYINYGADSGIRAGDTLAVSTVVKQLVDPGTGLSLGTAEQQIGELRVQTVNQKYSVALPVGACQTKRGDLVRIKPRA